MPHWIARLFEPLLRLLLPALGGRPYLVAYEREQAARRWRAEVAA